MNIAIRQTIDRDAAFPDVVDELRAEAIRYGSEFQEVAQVNHHHLTVYDGFWEHLIELDVYPISTGTRIRGRIRMDVREAIEIGVNTIATWWRARGDKPCGSM